MAYASWHSPPKGFQRLIDIPELQSHVQLKHPIQPFPLWCSNNHLFRAYKGKCLADIRVRWGLRLLSGIPSRFGSGSEWNWMYSSKLWKFSWIVHRYMLSKPSPTSRCSWADAGTIVHKPSPWLNSAYARATKSLPRTKEELSIVFLMQWAFAHFRKTSSCVRFPEK